MAGSEEYVLKREAIKFRADRAIPTIIQVMA